MGKIKGIEYSATRYNEDREKEYYIDDFDEWMTADEIQERKDEIGYWEEWAEDVYETNGDGLDWPD